MSGQNVAFLLVVRGAAAAPVGLRARWLVTLALVAWFAVVTPLEPSVLRACAVAGLAAPARYNRPRGRPAAGAGPGRHLRSHSVCLAALSCRGLVTLLVT